MKKLGITLAVVSLSLSGCTSTLESLDPPKNPNPTFSDPRPEKNTSGVRGESLFTISDYNVLRTAVDSHSPDGPVMITKKVDEEIMRAYLAAGFNISNTYCQAYLNRTDEAYRRRKFGRSVTNDAGTAVTSILDLANAGKDVITGSAALFGFGDSIWRNYDDSFLVTPDLSNVRELVLAAQENYREQVLGTGGTLPVYYSDAQTVIKKYAGYCSYLGMKGLLERSTTEKTIAVKQDTEQRKNPPAGSDSTTTTTESHPATTTTTITTTKPEKTAQPVSVPPV